MSDSLYGPHSAIGSATDLDHLEEELRRAKAERNKVWTERNEAWADLQYRNAQFSMLRADNERLREALGDVRINLVMPGLFSDLWLAEHNAKIDAALGGASKVEPKQPEREPEAESDYWAGWDAALCAAMDECSTKCNDGCESRIEKLEERSNTGGLKCSVCRSLKQSRRICEFCEDRIRLEVRNDAIDAAAIEVGINGVNDAAWGLNPHIRRAIKASILKLKRTTRNGGGE